MDKKARAGLQQIPGIGLNMEQHLTDLGYTDIVSLKGQDPEDIYLRDCLQKGNRS